MLFIWAGGRRGDGGAVVDGPLARRRGAARGRRGRGRRAERRHQPDRRQGLGHDRWAASSPASAGGLYAHYTTHIEQGNFNVLVATFAIAYPILGGLSNVFGTLAAVVFIQGFLIEGLRFLGDWRNLLFGALIVLAMNVRPSGLLDANHGKDLSALRRCRSVRSGLLRRLIDGSRIRRPRCGACSPNGEARSVLELVDLSQALRRRARPSTASACTWRRARSSA